jgi:hypothetical protein
MHTFGLPELVIIATAFGFLLWSKYLNSRNSND